MIAESGKCKINGIFVTEVNVKDLPNTRRSMEATYALGEVAKKGEAYIIHGTHGRCTAYTNNWSKETMDLLDKVMESMERDLAHRHFEVTAGTEGYDEGIESGEDETAGQI